MDAAEHGAEKIMEVVENVVQGIGNTLKHITPNVVLEHKHPEAGPGQDVGIRRGEEGEIITSTTTTFTTTVTTNTGGSKNPGLRCPRNTSGSRGEDVVSPIHDFHSAGNFDSLEGEVRARMQARPWSTTNIAALDNSVLPAPTTKLKRSNSTDRQPRRMFKDASSLSGHVSSRGERGEAGEFPPSVPGWEKVVVSAATKWHTPTQSPRSQHTPTLGATGQVSSNASLCSIDTNNSDADNHSLDAFSGAPNLFSKAAINDHINNEQEYTQVPVKDDDDGFPAVRSVAPLRSYRRAWSMDTARNFPSPTMGRHVIKAAEDLAQFAMRRDGKLLLAMVGLPARGKTFIAKAVIRHLEWLGFKCKLFNAGNYRREASGNHVSASADLFNMENEEGKRLRQRCAEAALHDALTSLQSDNVYMAVFDATNTTKARRAWLAKKVEDWGNESASNNVRLVFLESYCDDDELVWQNVKDAKLNSPDYEGWDAEAAMNDFLARIAQYKKVYEPLDEEEGHPFIRLENAGEKLMVYRAGGYAIGRVIQLLSHTQLELRGIILTRPGESTDSGLGRLGGTSGLTPHGQMYAMKFAETVKMVALGLHKADPLEVDVTQDLSECDFMVWSAASRDVTEFVQPMKDMGMNVIQLSCLNDMSFGLMEGLTYSQFAERFPEEYMARRKNKLNFRFPRGESYSDVFRRVEPILLELLGERMRVVVCAPLHVLRIIYGYLMAVAPEECCELDIPLNCILHLFPCGYGYNETRFFPLADAPSEKFRQKTHSYSEGRSQPFHREGASV